MTGLMEGKRGLIMGLANDRSLAWGVAKALREHGAELAFSYQKIGNQLVDTREAARGMEYLRKGLAVHERLAAIHHEVLGDGFDEIDRLHRFDEVRVVRNAQAESKAMEWGRRWVRHDALRD